MAQPATGQHRLRHEGVLRQRRYDSVGRKTYDWLIDYHKKQDTTEGLFDTNLKNFVFSRNPPQRPADGVTFVSETVEIFAQHLRATPGKNIWMMGGGELIASFLDAGEIDEFDIHVIPVLIGEGIPLIAPCQRDLPLRLRSSQIYPDGVVRIQYVVTC